MEIEILSLFPEYFDGPFSSSMIKRAQTKGLLSIRQVNIRDFAEKQRQVDDRPFGGGPGMVLKPEPMAKALQSVQREESHVVYLSPQGSTLNARKCYELTKYSHLILLCGHYEGIDERIVTHMVHEEISIGDYVLTNGCAAAIVLVDSVVRLIPGVLGHEKAKEEDSFQTGVFDWPHYTRPAEFNGLGVPQVLLQGNHAEITTWRKKQALLKTARVRPDLYWRSRFKEQTQESILIDDGSKLEISLPVENLKKSIRFYQKGLSLNCVEKNENQAVFLLGLMKLILVEGIVQKAPLLRLIVDSEKKFIEITRQVCRMISQELQIISREGEMQFTFSDSDGYSWMLVFPKGEKQWIS